MKRHKSFFITKRHWAEFCFQVKFPACYDQNLVLHAMLHAKCPLQRHRGVRFFRWGFVLVVCLLYHLGVMTKNPQPGLAFFYTNKKLGWIDRILDGHDLHDFEIWSFWMTFGDGSRWLKWYSLNCCRLCTNDVLQNSIDKRMDWIEWRFVLPGLKDTFIFFSLPS